MAMGFQMRRRDVLALLGGAAAPALLGLRAARAQQDTRVRRVGVLMVYPEDDPEGQERFEAFREGLAEFGWVEGRNLRIDVRWAGPDVARQRSEAQNLVALAPEVI